MLVSFLKNRTDILSKRYVLDPQNNPNHVKVDNPYDLSKPVEKIVARVKDANNANSQAITSNPDHMTWTIMGENHTSVADIMTQKMVITQLQKQGIEPFIALEWPHDSFGNTAQPKTLLFNKKFSSTQAPYGRASLYDQLSRDLVGAHDFSDASYSGFFGKLNLNDPTTKWAVELSETIMRDHGDHKQIHKNKSKISPLSPQGVLVRNIHILHKAYHSAKNQGLNNIVVPVGYVHQFGNTASKYFFDHSLNGLLQSEYYAQIIQGPKDNKTAPVKKGELSKTVINYFQDRELLNGLLPDKAYDDLSDYVAGVGIKGNSIFANGKNMAHAFWKASRDDKGNALCDEPTESLRQLKQSAKRRINQMTPVKAPAVA